MVLNLTDGTWTLEGRGNGAHGGLFTNKGSGGGYGAFGSGTVTLANGATMTWVMPGTSWHIEWPGIGTGKVGNATGGFNVVWESPKVQTPGPDPDTVTITYTYKGVGEIRY